MPVMKLAALIALIVSLVVTAAALDGDQAAQVRTFDHEPLGQPPASMRFGAMRQPAPGRWTVERLGADVHLVHAGDPAAAGYSLALRSEPVGHDVTVAVRVRFAGMGRTAGLVWRAADDRNFHALVLDLAANNLALYRVSAGNRVRIDVEDDLELDPGGWHALKVTHENSEIRVSLGGIGVFREHDRRDGQPAGSLRAGLLAGGASDVWFDDLRVESVRDKR
jgi:hypothetical protein